MKNEQLSKFFLLIINFKIYVFANSYDSLKQYKIENNVIKNVYILLYYQLISLANNNKINFTFQLEIN